MADPRNNPLFFVPMQSAWEGDRITITRASQGRGDPRAAGKSVANALRHALDAATYRAFEEEVLKTYEERRNGTNRAP